jgi:hypothetical protein
MKQKKPKKSENKTVTSVEAYRDEPALKAKDVCAMVGWTPSFLRRAREQYGLKFLKLTSRTFRYKLSWIKEWESERIKAG